ncbi:hypothetical protein A2768_00125 [Candidatus Roizmanbacteria bacterium RIFCSPHIGHO2_01_FULL_37_16]|nr:MAG: hypothetical protein A2768_00125 [Candidatus Roizmanbacteria bacterium RIFCSPHIGHO2_01_FULL_37_16]
MLEDVSVTTSTLRKGCYESLKCYLVDLVDVETLITKLVLIIFYQSSYNISEFRITVKFFNALVGQDLTVLNSLAGAFF